MKIGITVEPVNQEDKVSETLEECNSLLVITVDDNMIKQDVRVLDMQRISNPFDGTGIFLAKTMIENDCEAVITGSLKEEAFDLLADACITRYFGAGNLVLDALRMMENRELKLIRNLDYTDDCGGDHKHNHHHNHS